VDRYSFIMVDLHHLLLAGLPAHSIKEHEEGLAEKKAEGNDTREAVSSAAVQTMMQAPVALLGALFTAPGGATTALKTARILGRNFPLVLLLVMIGALFSPAASEAEASDVDYERKPIGLRTTGTYHARSDTS
jgi:hypothetical protein